MKAATSQIPVTASQKDSSERQPADSRRDTGVYAYIRRLEARIRALEEGQSTLRRDVNRIDKANSRAKSAQPSLPENPPAAEQPANALLFGGG